MTYSPPTPGDSRTAAEFVSAACRLKAWSGLSYRQLAKNAADNGDHLPASTLATALRRSSLPAEPVLAAFVRACGCDAVTADVWIAARRGIAMEAATGPHPAATTVLGPTVTPAPAVVRATVGPVIGVAARAVEPEPSHAPGPRAPRSPERDGPSPVPPAPTPSRLVPPVPSPRYRHAYMYIAARRARTAVRARTLAVAAATVACATGSVPAVQARGASYEVRTRTVAAVGADAGLPEGWYRIHTDSSGRCLGVRPSRGGRAPVTSEACRSEAEQRFFFEPHGGYYRIRVNGSGRDEGSRCLTTSAGQSLEARRCAVSQPGQRMLIKAISGERDRWLPALLVISSADDPSTRVLLSSRRSAGKERENPPWGDQGFYLTAVG